MRHVRSMVIAFTLLLGLAASANAGEIMRHSGSIFSIAENAKTFVLAEVGPWQLRDGRTVITYRTVTIAPETTYTIARRADAAPSGFRGDFVEAAVGPEDVYLNDYVTVECRHEGQRLVALKITVAELQGAETGY